MAEAAPPAGSDAAIAARAEANEPIPLEAVIRWLGRVPPERFESVSVTVLVPGRNTRAAAAGAGAEDRHYTVCCTYHDHPPMSTDFEALFDTERGDLMVKKLKTLKDSYGYSKVDTLDDDRWFWRPAPIPAEVRAALLTGPFPAYPDDATAVEEGGAAVCELAHPVWPALFAALPHGEDVFGVMAPGCENYVPWDGAEWTIGREDLDATSRPARAVIMAAYEAVLGGHDHILFDRSVSWTELAEGFD